LVVADAVQGNLNVEGGQISIDHTTSGRLELQGGTRADIIMTDTGGGSNTKKIQLVTEADAFKIRSLTDAGDAGTERMHFDLTNNRIGIGTTSPGQTFHVAGNGLFTGTLYIGTTLQSYNGDLYLKSNNSETEIFLDNDDIITFKTSNIERLRITDTLISGSATSTGSFGRVEVNSISASLYQGQIGSRYVHSQTSNSATWTINHNIGQKYPVVTVYDTSDQMILPQNGVATDSDTFTLTFNEAIQGKAVVSVGGIGTNAGANYIHTQGGSSTNWRVTHSLSQQYPNVTVYDDLNQVIIPETITAASSNEMDITFSSGKSGYANFSIGSGIPNISAENAGKVLKVRYGGQGVEWSPTSNDVSGSMSVSGSITPTIDNFHNLGSATHRWANLHTGDIQLSNEGSEGNEVDGTTGSWTIQEGEDDLYLLNRKNGKKYKFKLEEIT